MRKLQLLVAMLAMVLLAASPAMAQPIEFVEGGVLVVVEGTGSLEEPPITGVFAVPDLGGGTVAGGGTFATALPEFGAFADVDETTFAAIAPEFGTVVQAGELCIDTTDLGFCP